MSVSGLVNRLKKLKYQRVVLKLSGEILGEDTNSFTPSIFDYITNEIISVHKLGVKLGIVIGGGNIIRGSLTDWFNRIHADLCGMVATIINGIVLYSLLKEKNIPVQLRSNLEIKGLVPHFDKLHDKSLYNSGNVMILVGGTGNPLFTTDTASAILANELNADLLIKGTKVEGVYSADPLWFKNAKFYSHLKFQEAIEKRLKVMDITAFNICKDSKIPICVYNIMKHRLSDIVKGKKIGTLVS